MLAPRQNSVSAPFIVEPTGDWDGDDGLWSTFAVGVGTPAQTFRILPSIVGEEVWVPLPGGCSGPLAGISDCGQLRGVNNFDNAPSRGFMANDSSTWQSLNIYNLSTEQTLFPNAALYGLDTVVLNSTSSEEETLQGQTIGTYTTEDFWLGTLGLGTSPGTFQGLPSPVSSLLVSMKSHNVTPSLSYGYTAGKSYASPRILGSLILGGYDTSRITSNNISVSINSSSAQALQLSVQNILGTNTLQGASQSLLSSPITVNLDSAVSQLWLPPAVCNSFAQAFSLTYDSSTGLYLVNSTVHAQLKSNDPSVTFTIGSTSGGSTLNLVLNYNAFDLEVGVPIYNSSMPYFPIRQATSPDQYTLGRTFLQEAYLIVDWERANFTIGSVPTTSTTPVVHAILPVTTSTSGVTTSSVMPQSHKSNGISGGAIGGIVVAVIVILGLCLGAFFFVRRRNRRRGTSRRPAELPANSVLPPPFDDHYPSDKDHATKQDQYVTQTPVYELHEDYKPHTATELGSNPVHELSHNDPVLIELAGSTAGSELDVHSPRLNPQRDSRLSEADPDAAVLLARTASGRPSAVRHLSGLSDTSVGSTRPLQSRHLSGLSDVSLERSPSGRPPHARHLSGMSDVSSVSDGVSAVSGDRLSGMSSPTALPSPPATDVPPLPSLAPGLAALVEGPDDDAVRRESVAGLGIPSEERRAGGDSEAEVAEQEDHPEVRHE